MTELEWWGNVYNSAATSGDTYRIIIGVDHEPLGALPAVTDVLESASSIAPYNKDKVGSRFRIIADEIGQVIPSAATTTIGIKAIHGKKKLDFVTYYQSNAGTISDLLRNNMFAIVLSGNTGVNCSLNV